MEILIYLRIKYGLRIKIHNEVKVNRRTFCCLIDIFAGHTILVPNTSRIFITMYPIMCLLVHALNSTAGITLLSVYHNTS